MSKERIIAVLWICDKKDCISANYRTILLGETIISDSCDCCGRSIREPLWEEILINEETERDGNTW